jgi:hypothetical protein
VHTVLCHVCIISPFSNILKGMAAYVVLYQWSLPGATCTKVHAIVPIYSLLGSALASLATDPPLFPRQARQGSWMSLLRDRATTATPLAAKLVRLRIFWRLVVGCGRETCSDNTNMCAFVWAPSIRGSSRRYRSRPPCSKIAWRWRRTGHRIMTWSKAETPAPCCAER